MVGRKSWPRTRHEALTHLMEGICRWSGKGFVITWPNGELDGDIGRCHPVIAQGRSELGHLATNGVMGDDTVSFFDGTLWGIDRRVEGPQQSL
jgi:hypothetical protein